MAPATQKQGKEERYVVTSTMVDDWKQGQVIDRDSFHLRDDRGESVHDRFDRLTKLGAIRPLAPGEEGMDQIPAHTMGGMSAAAQMKLATLDAEIHQLTRVVADLEEKAAFHTRAGTIQAAPPPGGEDPQVALVIEQKQAALEGLKTRLEAVAAQLDQGQQALAERHQQAAEAQQKQDREAGQPRATGTAMPVNLPEGGGQQSTAVTVEQGKLQPVPQPPPSGQQSEKDVRERAEKQEAKEREAKGKKG